MSVRNQTLAAVGIALAAGGGFFYWWQGNNTPDVVVGSTTTIEPAPSTESNVDELLSPFDPVEPSDATISQAAQQTTASTTVSSSTSKPPRATPTASEEALALQAYELGVTDLSDEQILDFTLRLKSDAAFLQAVADEFRAESDPERLKRLSLLLGEAQDPSLTPVASDMVYSGNRESQLAGLDLLRRLQPFDPSARDVVMNILTTEADPEVMVGTLNVLALPGQATDAEKQTIVDHVLPLTTNYSAAVRQRSISMISKWSDDDTAMDVLVAGLNDVDESVRKTAAYSTLGLKNPSPEIIEALFSVLEDQNELPRARKGARQSLQGKTLSESNKLRLQTADAQMRKQYARKP